MLNIDLVPDRNIVVFAPDGPLAATDFARAAQAIDPLMAANGKLAGLMIHTPSFPGWRDFDAVKAHLKFVRNHQRRIGRLAVVTDGAFVKMTAGRAHERSVICPVLWRKRHKISNAARPTFQGMKKPGR